MEEEVKVSQNRHSFMKMKCVMMKDAQDCEVTDEKETGQFAKFATMKN